MQKTKMLLGQGLKPHRSRVSTRSPTHVCAMTLTSWWTRTEKKMPLKMRRDLEEGHCLLDVEVDKEWPLYEYFSNLTAKRREVRVKQLESVSLFFCITIPLFW